MLPNDIVRLLCSYVYRTDIQTFTSYSRVNKAAFSECASILRNNQTITMYNYVDHEHNNNESLKKIAMSMLDSKCDMKCYGRQFITNIIDKAKLDGDFKCMYNPFFIEWSIYDKDIDSDGKWELMLKVSFVVPVVDIRKFIIYIASMD